MTTFKKIVGHCSCHSVAIEAQAPAIFRFYCHCTICQKFNDAQYADVTAFYAKNIGSIDESKINFKVHQQPPLVRRGTCAECDTAALETISIPLMPKLIVVPSRNFESLDQLPAPRMHMFYDRRVVDIDDDLKKHFGYLSSQLGFNAALLKGMFSSSRK